MQKRSILVFFHRLFLLMLFFPVVLQGQDQPWQIQLTVTNGDISTTLRLGASENATDAFDAGIDQVAPPAGFSFYAVFMIGTFPNSLRADLRAIEDSSHVWKINLLNTGGSESTISWHTDSLKQIMAIDTLMIEQTDMLSDSSLQVSGDAVLTIAFRKRKPSPTGAFSDENRNPHTFQLFQNYPNPFALSENVSNPETFITFRIPKQSNATVRIYDLLGRKVKTLFDGAVGAEEQRISWDGRNDNGELVPKGVYFYKLTTGYSSANRRLLLLR